MKPTVNPTKKSTTKSTSTFISETGDVSTKPERDTIFGETRSFLDGVETERSYLSSKPRVNTSSEFIAGLKKIIDK